MVSVVQMLQFSVIRLFLITCFAIVTVASNAQIIPEDDIPFKITKWHYTRFENSQNAVWKKLSEENAIFYEAKFNYKNNKFYARYDEKGSIKYYLIYLDVDKMPASIKDHIDNGIDKYKVVDFHQYVAFDTPFADPEISYRVSLKNKKVVNRLVFDKLYQPIVGIGTLADVDE